MVGCQEVCKEVRKEVSAMFRRAFWKAMIDEAEQARIGAAKDHGESTGGVWKRANVDAVLTGFGSGYKGGVPRSVKIRGKRSPRMLCRFSMTLEKKQYACCFAGMLLTITLVQINELDIERSIVIDWVFLSFDVGVRRHMKNSNS